MMTRERVPRHLSTESKKLYSHVIGSYDLPPHQLKTLRLACEALDRSTQAREVINEKGLTMLDRFEQEKPRPEVAIERDSRISYARLMRELYLEDVAPGSDLPECMKD